jgi:hypothetical protein
MGELAVSRAFGDADFKKGIQVSLFLWPDITDELMYFFPIRVLLKLKVVASVPQPVIQIKIIGTNR